jgi:CDP-glucose 4,6-dehydratase
MESVVVSPPPGESLRGRTVFLTGHTGFKGSWLAIWLRRLKARVVGYSLDPPTQPSNFIASAVRDTLAAHHHGDVRDTPRLSAVLKAAEADIVIHMAAQSLVRVGFASPLETFDVNVMGTASLLEAVRRAGRPMVVLVVTSDKCYENREQLWGYREMDPMGGNDPYSASKGAAELIVAAYRRSFFDPRRLGGHGVKLASVRAGNVIGGGDWAKDRIVPDIVRAFTANVALGVRNPQAVRPWQHVLEPLCGYLTLAARMLQSDDPCWCGAWNFGPARDECVPVRRLVEEFCKAWGGGQWKDQSDPQAAPEATVLRLNTEKAFWELGWRPRWTLAEAVRRTAAWHRRFAAGGPPMLQSCLDDIAAYEQALPQ